MCTLTVIPLRRDGRSAAGYRLVTNRDERHDRPRAEAPTKRRAGDRCAVWPIDPAGGGTWIAVNDRALTLSILNLNLDPPPRRRWHGSPSRAAGDVGHKTQHRSETCATRSRGLLIPRLIDAETADQAMAKLDELDLSPFDPFRLIAVDPLGVRVARWDRRSLTGTPSALAPMCLVSSGLGDHVVSPRLELFREWFASRGFTAEAQDAFHAHRWPDRPEISVMMSRDDARTVSVTTVEAPAEPERPLRMRYGEVGTTGETPVPLDTETGETPVPPDQAIEVDLRRGASLVAISGPTPC